MRILQYAALVFFASVLSAVAQIGDVTADPLNHLRGFYDMDGVTKIYKVEVDLNNDGIKEMLLAPLEPDEDESDLGWFVYIGRPNGQYVLAGEVTDTGIRADSVVSFDKNNFFCGWISQVSQYGILSVTSGAGGQAMCQLKAIVIVGDGCKQILIDQPVSAENSFSTLTARFLAAQKPTIQELSP